MYRQEEPRSESFAVQAVSESISPENGAVGGVERPVPPQDDVPGAVVYLSDRGPRVGVVVVARRRRCLGRGRWRLGCRRRCLRRGRGLGRGRGGGCGCDRTLALHAGATVEGDPLPRDDLTVNESTP